MSLVCPQCNATIATHAIHSKTARCPECGYQFSVARLLQADEERKKAEIVYDLPMPARIQKVVDADKLVITRTWDRFEGVGLLLFSIPFTGATLYMLLIFLTGNWIVTLHLIAFFFGVIYMWVKALRNIFNITTIEVEPHNITVRHLPFPAYKSVFPSDIIVQVYVKANTHNRQSGFDIVLILVNGRHGILLKNIPHPEQAQYIEQEIEKFLGIVDAPVRGEYGREQGFLSRLANVFFPKQETKYKF
jgi:hypothetical protein